MRSVRGRRRWAVGRRSGLSWLWLWRRRGILWWVARWGGRCCSCWGSLFGIDPNGHGHCNGFEYHLRVGNPDNVASMPVVVPVWLNHGHSCSGSEESARGDEKAVGIHDNAEYAHDFCFVSVLFLGG